MTGHVIHVTTHTTATPESVWEVLTDLPHTAEILRSVKSASLLTEGEYAVGTTWREERTFFGHHGAEELHVVESDPPHRTLHETRLGPDRATTAYSIQRSSDGNTKLFCTATLDVRERSARQRFFWNAFGEHSYHVTRKMLEQDLEDIAHEAERRDQRAGGSHRAS